MTATDGTVHLTADQRRFERSTERLIAAARAFQEAHTSYLHAVIEATPDLEPFRQRLQSRSMSFFQALDKIPSEQNPGPETRSTI